MRSPSEARIWVEGVQPLEPHIRMLCKGSPKAKVQRPRATEGSEESWKKTRSVVHLLKPLHPPFR